VKQKYKEINLRRDTLQLIAFINQMIDDYLAQGFRLSVRQLYYQLVARGVVENTEKSYKRVASIINDGRLAGLIDWDAIEDRGRDVVMQTRWLNGSQIINAAASSYHMDMWDNQLHRVFVIVEKAALAGVLEGVCREYDVPLLAARGYPSVSILREMTIEHIQSALNDEQIPCVLHLGDHDPSGIDMTRDLDERIRLFAEEHHFNNELSIKRIALTMNQIEEKNPPPNPAKTTDARFIGYRRKYGTESWELDALEPAYLVNLVRQNIESVLDEDAWAKRKKEVETIRARLKKAAKSFDRNAA
jgi:hypothetical protein